nr:MAG TPA: hypothetical protein [Caudoviricetes sp.]
MVYSNLEFKIVGWYNFFTFREVQSSLYYKPNNRKIGWLSSV